MFWFKLIVFLIISVLIYYRRGFRSKLGDRKRFLSYCIYAFGVPIFLTFFAVVADTTEIVPEFYRPWIGIDRCWVQNNKAVEAIYVYGPILIIIIVNITFFATTAYKIYRVQKETKMVRTGDSGRHSSNDLDKAR
jgi:Na+/H+ antiporter NhaC